MKTNIYKGFLFTITVSSNIHFLDSGGIRSPKDKKDRLPVCTENVVGSVQTLVESLSSNEKAYMKRLAQEEVSTVIHPIKDKFKSLIYKLWQMSENMSYITFIMRGRTIYCLNMNFSVAKAVASRKVTQEFKWF